MEDHVCSEVLLLIKAGRSKVSCWMNDMDDKGISMKYYTEHILVVDLEDYGPCGPLEPM
jgi:hypothetical protein